MDINIWAAYLLTEFLLQISPGPAVLLVSAQGLKYGAKSSAFGALGISTGNLLYFILSALGLGAFILAAGPLFYILKIIGALYLLILGLKMIYFSFVYSAQTKGKVPLLQSLRKSFAQGFLTQIANPKAIIFFVALLPQFIDPTNNITLQFAILGLSTLVMETFILFAYGWLSARAKKRLGENSVWIKWQDRIAGLLLISLAMKLFLLKEE